jgi:oxaloacetate decarboxylase alpha subunit
VRNVIDPERWSNVSDETIRYFLGHYGDPAAPVAAEVAERVLSLPRAAELRHLEPLQLEGARARFGRGISDEELLLRLTMPEEQVDAMLAAPHGAVDGRRRVGATRHHPVVTLLREVAKRPSVTHLRVQKGDELVEWRRAT